MKHLKILQIHVNRNGCLTINDDCILFYFECFASSFDKTCSLTLPAFLESFPRIAEQTSPVT